MKATISLSIRNQPPLSRIDLIGPLKITHKIHRKIIIINEVLSGIVRRIYIYKLDFPKVGPLKKLQGLQVIAFNK